MSVHVVFIKLFQPHHRSVILSAEPLAALPTLTPSSSVATRHSASKLASALAAPSARSADVAAIAMGVSQARPRLRLGRGVSKLPLCARLARGFAPCAIVLPQAVLHNLLTLGNAQASLALRSLNRRFRERLVRATPRRSVRRHAWRWLWAKPAKPRCQ